MKKLIISSFFVMFAVLLPINAKADFDPAQLIDPFCWFACDDDEPENVYNTYTNSNNVNSNVNSPGGVVNNSGNNSGNEVDGDGLFYYTSDLKNPSSSPVANANYNYNYNYNNNDGGGTDYYDGSGSYPRLTVECYASDSSIEVGDRVTWRAYPHGGNGNYNVSWRGTNGLDGDGTSITHRYNTPGTKNATVTVRSAGQTISRNCESIEVYEDYDDYYNDSYDYYDGSNRSLYVSCSADVTFAPVGTRVTWTAYASGGSGSYRYEWNGHENLRGTSRSVSAYYNNSGIKSASVKVRSGSRTVTQVCSNTVLVGVRVAYNPPPVYAPVYTPAPVKTVVVEKIVEKKVDVTPSPSPEVSVASLFSLQNVPWGWVAALVIIVLLITVIYLLVNRTKI